MNAKVVVILIFLLSINWFNISAQNQFVNLGNEWYNSIEYNDQRISYKFKFIEDTLTIDSLHFLRLASNSMANEAEWEDTYYRYAEKNGITYGMYNDDENYETLYNINLKIGDTITHSDQFTGIVSDIDSIELNSGIKRKRIHFEGSSLTWVKGIGNNYDGFGFYLLSDRYLSNTNDCYHVNGSLEYSQRECIQDNFQSIDFVNPNKKWNVISWGFVQTIKDKDYEFRKENWSYLDNWGISLLRLWEYDYLNTNDWVETDFLYYENNQNIYKLSSAGFALDWFDTAQTIGSTIIFAGEGLTLETKDSVQLFNGDCRERFIYKHESEFCEPVLYIEGFGILNGPFGEAGNFEYCNQDGGRYISRIYENNELIYIRSELDACGITNSTNSIDTKAKIYPNPAQERLTIEDYQFDNYSIISVNGNTISSGKSKSSIDISLLESGMYFLQLSKAEVQMIHKFFKQ